MVDSRGERAHLLDPLSERELEILLLMAEGCSNAEIGERLSLALSTVKWYNTQIYSKLGVANRADAIRQARLLGLFEDSGNQREELPHNLPAQTTAFVGRLEELGELGDLLQDTSTRLITILAPGGMGKTRLALQVAQQQMHLFPHGVYFVSLAPLKSPELILGAIMDAVGYRVRQNNNEQTISIAEFLHGRRLLLLDNFEHLLAGSQTVSDLLQSVPDLKIIVTSRERLNLRGETVYMIGGLRVPGFAELDAIRSSDATRLFVQAARRARPDFVLTDYDLPHIARITALVDGMPLALELAAGWMEVLHPERIVTEIQHCIDILETEMRDVPERHRSIRAIFNHAWNDLSPHEQTIFARLSVFHGGFSADAARVVCGADLRDLRRLANKALIMPGFGGRYDIHELLRQFSEAKLEESGMFAATRSAHSRYYVHRVVEEYEHLTISFRELDSDTRNILAAWNHLLEERDFAEIARVQHDLMLFLSGTGYMPDAIELYRKAAQLVSEALVHDPALKPLHGHLVYSRIEMDLNLYPDEPYEEELKQAIAWMELEGPSPRLAWACCTLGEIQWRQESINEAEVLAGMDQLHERIRALNAPQAEIQFLQLMSNVHLKLGNFPLALQLATASYEQVHALGITSYIAYQSADQMAFLAVAEQRPADAIRYWEEALRYAEQSTVVHTVAHAHTMLSRQYLDLGDLAKVKSHMRQVLLVHQHYAHDWQTLGAMYGAYGRHYLLAREAYEQAAVVFACVAHHPMALGYIRTDAEKFLAETRPHLPPDEFEKACAKGKQITLRELLREALTVLS